RRNCPLAARASKGCGVPPDGPLRLRAEDAEDLAVISACLQDALVSVRDLAYDREARTFVLVANRFRWEASEAERGEAGRFERTLCGVALGEVESVAYRGFQRSEESRILCLLAIRATDPERGGAIAPGFCGVGAHLPAGTESRRL